MKLSLYPRNINVSHCFKAAFAVLVIALGAGISHGQARQEIGYDFSQNQFTGVFQRTLTDYSLLNENNTSASRIELNGGTAEYSWRRFYPFEVIGRASYSTGNPLSQKLMSFTAGAGYTRQIHRRYYPFARITAGMAHTSSPQYQYLQKGINGFALNLDGGLDIDIKRQRWGVRAIELQNQYLPFGVNNLGSVYWSFGAGAYIRFGK